MHYLLLTKTVGIRSTIISSHVLNYLFDRNKQQGGERVNAWFGYKKKDEKWKMDQTEDEVREGRKGEWGGRGGGKEGWRKEQSLGCRKGAMHRMLRDGSLLVKCCNA